MVAKTLTKEPEVVEETNETTTEEMTDAVNAEEMMEKNKIETTV
jgi:hypothetical protein